MADSAGPGIRVGMSGLNNADVDTVRFVSCVATGFAGNGLEILQGQNIQVVGGSFNGNGNAGGAGIAVLGAADQVQIQGVNCIGPAPSAVSTLVQQYGILIEAGTNVQIAGCDCSGTGSADNPGVGISISNESGTTSDVRVIGSTAVGEILEMTASSQQYGASISGAANVYINDCTFTKAASGGAGVSISGGATAVFVSDCDCSVNSYGVSVTGSCENVYLNGCNLNNSGITPLHTSTPGTLQVINCPGYNDQGTVLSGTPLNGISFNGPTFSYYGPVAFYTISSSAHTISQIEIDGTITHLTSGGFTLNAPAPDGASYAGQSAIITYSTSGITPLDFVIVGQ
jgi:hypothetical protein